MSRLHADLLKKNWHKGADDHAYGHSDNQGEGDDQAQLGAGIMDEKTDEKTCQAAKDTKQHSYFCLVPDIAQSSF